MINAPITTTNRLKHSAEIVTEKLTPRQQEKKEAGTGGSSTSAETAKKKRIKNKEMHEYSLEAFENGIHDLVSHSKICHLIVI